jgi:hypothetical protein
MITSEDRARGFLHLSTASPNTRDDQEWRAFCHDADIPIVYVRQARFWQVEVSAVPLLFGQFTAEDQTWLHGRAAVALHESPSSAPRIEINPVRMRALGMTEEEAIALAKAVAGHFRHLAIMAGRSNARPMERPRVIYIATERAKRRPRQGLRERVQGSTFGVFRDPWNGDAS